MRIIHLACAGEPERVVLALYDAFAPGMMSSGGAPICCPASDSAGKGTP